jgi:hypothetical protein
MNVREAYLGHSDRQLGAEHMMDEHPAVTHLRRDIKVFQERKRRLEAGEMPGIDTRDGHPPANFDRKAEITRVEAKIAELSAQLKDINPSG